MTGGHVFHETCHFTFIVLVNSHQRWKQTRNRVCFHLWCELTLVVWCHSFIWSLFFNRLNVTEWQVSWNSWSTFSLGESLSCHSHVVIDIYWLPYNMQIRLYESSFSLQNTLVPILPVVIMHECHETCYSVTLIVLVCSHQRWKQMQNHICFHFILGVNWFWRCDITTLFGVFFSWNKM